MIAEKVGDCICRSFFLYHLAISLDFLKYFTLNTLFDTAKILEDSGYTREFVIMALLSPALYGIGILWFQKKDLPL